MIIPYSYKYLGMRIIFQSYNDSLGPWEQKLFGMACHISRGSPNYSIMFRDPQVKMNSREEQNRVLANDSKYQTN